MTCADVVKNLTRLVDGRRLPSGRIQGRTDGGVPAGRGAGGSRDGRRLPSGRAQGRAAATQRAAQRRAIVKLGLRVGTELRTVHDETDSGWDARWIRSYNNILSVMKSKSNVSI